MILYAPYEARYDVAFVLREHLNAAAQQKSVPDVMSLFAGIGLYDTDMEASVREGFQVILQRYSEGNPPSNVLDNEGDAAALPPQVREAFMQDENSILFNRFIERQDIFCKTEAAKLIAMRDAWRDIDALSQVYQSGLADISEEYVDAFSGVAEKIKTELACAERRARIVKELRSGNDYDVAPKPRPPA